MIRRTAKITQKVTARERPFRCQTMTLKECEQPNVRDSGCCVESVSAFTQIYPAFKWRKIKLYCKELECFGRKICCKVELDPVQIICKCWEVI